jgi:hypothetical protein
MVRTIYGLRYVSGEDLKLQGYTDYDWARSVVDRNSTSGCCFSMGLGMISWLSRMTFVMGVLEVP